MNVTKVDTRLSKKWLREDLFVLYLILSDYHMEKYSQEELKGKLTPLQYKVTQEGFTEPAFESKLLSYAD